MPYWLFPQHGISGPYTFVLGFTAHSVLPRIVMPTVVEFARMVYTEGSDPWKACVAAFTRDAKVLTHSQLVLITRDTGGAVKSRTLVYSIAHSRVWGLEPKCGRVPPCSAQLGDVSSKIKPGRSAATNNNGVASWNCRNCQWESGWVTRPEWVNQIAGHNFYFWYDYPLTEPQSRYVIMEGRI
jgi:hypothetical protein